MSVSLTHAPAAEFDVREERFALHLRDTARHYFAEMDSSEPQVRLVHHAKRVHSQLLQLEVTDGRLSRQVIYKIPFCLENTGTNEPGGVSRPRLFPEISPVTNGLREFSALKSIEEHFQSLDKERFGVVSVFELLEMPFVVVMEKCRHGDLKSLLKRSTRFHRQSPHKLLPQAFANAGAWLREFHTLPDLKHTELRHATPDGFVDATERFTSGLIEQLGRPSFFTQLCHRLVTAAEHFFPSQLPLGVLHADFAPRNILVAGDSQVTVFDTQRRWRAPVYEDLAYFLMSLKTPGPQVRSQGALFPRTLLAHWETEFLNGYFKSADIPLAAVRLYECLLTLEWWCAINFRLNKGSFKHRASLALSNRFLFRYIEQLVAEL